MANKSLTDFAPTALGRLVTGMTIKEVEAVIGREYVPVGIKVPAPKQFKAWDEFWTRYHAEKSLLDAYSRGELRENVTLTTSEPDYAWVNPLQIWGPGTCDLAKGEVHISGYAV